MELTTRSTFSAYLLPRVVNRASKDKYTHISMDGIWGGLFNIRDTSEFQQEYASAISKGGAYYLCEMKTKIFKMFMDLDFAFTDSSTQLTLEQKIQIVSLAQSVVTLFYPKCTPQSSFTCFVCDTEETSNLHVYMPKLEVNEEQAIIMALAIISKLDTILGNMDGLLDKGWDDIVDTSVYIKNGLRLVGSRKCKPCPTCKNKKRGSIVCVKCGNIGKVDVGRVYRLFTVLDHGEVNVDKVDKCKNFATLLNFCSLRTESKAPTLGWKKYIGCPTIDRSHLKRARPTDANVDPSKRWDMIVKQDSKKDTALSTYSIDKKGEQQQRSFTVSIGHNTHHFRVCLGIIQRFASVYQRIGVRDIKTTSKKNIYRVTVKGEGANFCHNLVSPKHEHNSNTVYFLIKPNGVVQRCWCRCATTKSRKNGLCSGYTSAPKKLYTNEISILFPMQKVTGFGYVKKNPKQQQISDILTIYDRLYTLAHIPK